LLTITLHHIIHNPYPHLDGKSLNLVAESLDLSSQLTSLVGVNASSNDRAADTASTAKQRLAGDVDVGSALVLAQQGNVQQDGKGLGVGGEDGDFASTTVEGLGDYIITPVSWFLTLPKRKKKKKKKAINRDVPSLAPFLD
jgi:hypothetical protein